jgi:hypothetical protein
MLFFKSGAKIEALFLFNQIFFKKNSTSPLKNPSREIQRPKRIFARPFKTANERHRYVNDFHGF